MSVDKSNIKINSVVGLLPDQTILNKATQIIRKKQFS